MTKIYDISQRIPGCEVFAGDAAPVLRRVMSIGNGDACNLTEFSMCAHNGTHVDAPLHFMNDGCGIGDISLEKFIGRAYVAGHEGDVTASDAATMMERAARASAGAERRILIKGRATVTLEAARVFAQAGIDLVGNESMSVGPEDAPMEVHQMLLGAGVVLLEGIRLQHVPDGVYHLNCAPLNLGATDGAPCRATLMEMIF